MQDSPTKNASRQTPPRLSKAKHTPNLRASGSPHHKNRQPPAPHNWQKSYANLVLILTLFWLLPASWVALSPPFSRPLFATQTTHKRLAKLNQIIQDFRKKYKITPENFTTIRAFAIAEKQAFNGYDSFGQRLDYMRLSDRHYLVRSFGADGVQNTTRSAPDLGIVQWGQRPDSGLIYQYNKATVANYYPAVLLEGSESPNRQWLAKLFVDVDSRSRRLVLRHLRRKGLFMVASHDQIEEFLWLPNGEQLVFTGSGSLRNRDGLYLWNLANDETINLLDVVADALVISPAARESGVFLSLAGISPATGNKPTTVYAYFNFRSDGPLSPEAFFVREQIIAFTLPEPGTLKKEVPKFLGMGAPGIDAEFASPRTRLLNPKANIELGTGLKNQQAWLSLPMSGDMEAVLMAWQNYIEKQHSSPLFPYALWVLGSFYNESYAIMAAKRRPEADIIRTYGTEVARALVHYPGSPTYLRALGLDLYETLIGGRSVHQRLGQLQLPVGRLNESAPSIQIENNLPNPLDAPNSSAP